MKHRTVQLIIYTYILIPEVAYHISIFYNYFFYCILWPIEANLLLVTGILRRKVVENFGHKLFVFTKRAEWCSTHGLLELLPMVPTLCANTMATSQCSAGFRRKLVQTAWALTQLLSKDFKLCADLCQYLCDSGAVLVCFSSHIIDKPVATTRFIVGKAHGIVTVNGFNFLVAGSFRCTDKLVVICFPKCDCFLSNLSDGAEDVFENFKFGE